jgi:hypothetical protein
MKPIIVLIVSAFLLSCKRPVHRESEIKRIEFARAGVSINPGVTIGIDETLDYKYFGDYENTHQKYFVGEVSPQFWDTLTKKLETIKFKTVAAAIDPGAGSEENTMS